MARFKLTIAFLFLIVLAVVAMPEPGNAAAKGKQITVTGTIDCGQDTCSVVPPKGSGQPPLYFMIQSAQGSKILKQAQACSFARPLQMTVVVDSNENVIDVLKVTCAK